jgi:hypothetical protein
VLWASSCIALPVPAWENSRGTVLLIKHLLSSNFRFTS